MLLFIFFIQMVFADESSVVQVMDPMPIISVDDGRKVPMNEAGMNASTVDTEMPSPLAPQNFDGFAGVVQEPFAPTESELEQMRMKQQEETKRLTLERMAQEKKAAAAMMASLPAKKGKSKVAAVKAKPGKPVSAKPSKRLPAATKVRPAPKKPGALKVAPKQNKK